MAFTALLWVMSGSTTACLEPLRAASKVATAHLQRGPFTVNAWGYCLSMLPLNDWVGAVCSGSKSLGKFSNVLRDNVPIYNDYATQFVTGLERPNLHPDKLSFEMHLLVLKHYFFF